jgi:hypothetical protein
MVFGRWMQGGKAHGDLLKVRYGITVRSIQRTSLYCIAHVQKYMSSGPHGGLGDDTPHVDHQE